MKSANFLHNACMLFVSLLFSIQLTAQQTANPWFGGLRWRMIGPFRGGRTVGATGVPQQPNVFYIGVNNGGVWKTTDYGRTWNPVFDDQPTGSIGDVAVAPTNPDVIYAASGEGIQRPDLSVGDGLYKSTNGGKTWINTGLQNAQQIAGLAIDPVNENRVFAAVLGHPYGPNTERGVYRTTNGGTSWERVFYLDENTGAAQVTIDPKNPQTVYADLWAGRQGPWENGAWEGPESGLFKSTDGGTTWNRLANGLPSTREGLGRIGFCIAPSDPQRLYATVNSEKGGGLYRSNDGGSSWKMITSDERLWGRGDDFAELKCDPKNADILYDANVVTWKSTDAGENWTAFRGAPGGDDYHRLWINPDHPEIILLVADQGAIITVNGGQTWGSWYNQPTAQFYHVSTDNAFPYNVYGGQQESGSVGISSRGNDGEITFHDWHPVGVEEYGYIAADPLDPNIIYGGKITRFDKRNGQVTNISPEAVRSGKYRFLRTAPVLFSPIDPHTLYFAGNVLFKTRDGGNSWQVISPDLSRDKWDVPESIGIYRKEEMKTMPRRGVIYTVAPSPLDINILWAGTDDGLIHITKDGGKTWKNITPPTIDSWSKISMLEAGHSDKQTVYAAVNRIRLDDQKPHIYVTHNGGESWKEMVNGLPDGPVNTVREDPVRKGLLFAGTEKNVFVSFDDGMNWETLRLNMPATSIRDLVIKDDDLVVGTHGRSFWILDNITALRQVNAKLMAEQVVLFRPQKAVRIRYSMYTDTPYPQEEPAGENPPDGAIIDYYLKEKVQGEITMDILDSTGKMVRHYSSLDTLYKIRDVNIPLYWTRPQQILSGDAGAHRFLWDLHYTPLNLPPSYPISAVFQNTAPQPTGAWAMPGKYVVKLMANGNTYTQSFTLRMDPRVKTSIAGLKLQFSLSMHCRNERLKAMLIRDTLNAAALFFSRYTGTDEGLRNALKNAVNSLNLLAQGSGRNGPYSFAMAENEFASMFNTLHESDTEPTTQLIRDEKGTETHFAQLLLKWQKFRDGEFSALQKRLANSGGQ